MRFRARSHRLIAFRLICALGERQATVTLMDTLRMLAELREERDQLDEAIQVLQRLASGHGKRKGRPPKWMAADSESKGTSPRRRKPFSAATRKKMALAQKRRWAAKRAQ